MREPSKCNQRSLRMSDIEELLLTSHTEDVIQHGRKIVVGHLIPATHKHITVHKYSVQLSKFLIHTQ